MRTYFHIITTTLFLASIIASWAQKSSSPFDPPATKTPVSKPKVAPVPPKPVATKEFSSEIEMRGYFKLGEDYFFSIHQKKVDAKAKSKKSEWLKIGDTEYGKLGFRAVRFNSKTEVLVMERGGMTEEIALHESQFGKKPNPGKSSSRRGPFPSPRSTARTRIMPPKPRTTPVVPTALQPSPSRTQVPPASRPASGQPETSSSNPSPRVSASPSGGAGPFLPGRISKPSTNPTVPSSGSTVTTGVTPAPRVSEVSGKSNPSSPLPSDTIKNISTGGTNASGEIDLFNLPPPPPPPNILPPGPPPDIQPSLGDR